MLLSASAFYLTFVIALSVVNVDHFSPHDFEQDIDKFMSSEELKGYFGDQVNGDSIFNHEKSQIPTPILIPPFESLLSGIKSPFPSLGSGDMLMHSRPRGRVSMTIVLGHPKLGRTSSGDVLGDRSKSELFGPLEKIGRGMIQSMINDVEKEEKENAPVGSVDNEAIRFMSNGVLGLNADPTVGQKGDAAVVRKDDEKKGQKNNAAVGHKDNSAVGHKDNSAVGHKDNSAVGHKDNAAIENKNKHVTGNRDFAKEYKVNNGLRDKSKDTLGRMDNTVKALIDNAVKDPINEPATDHKDNDEKKKDRKQEYYYSDPDDIDGVGIATYEKVIVILKITLLSVLIFGLLIIIILCVFYKRRTYLAVPVGGRNCKCHDGSSLSSVKTYK